MNSKAIWTAFTERDWQSPNKSQKLHFSLVLPSSKCCQLWAEVRKCLTGQRLIRSTSRNFSTKMSNTHFFQKPTGIYPQLFYLLQNVSFSFKLDEIARQKVILSVWSVSIPPLSSRKCSARQQTLLHFLCSQTFNNSQREGMYPVFSKFFL